MFAGPCPQDRKILGLHIIMAQRPGICRKRMCPSTSRVHKVDVNMTKDPLFQPQQSGSLTLPNRVVMITIKLGHGTQSGELNDHHITFYTRRGQGEAALLTTEPLFFQENGRELSTQLGIMIMQLTPTRRSQS